jgi:hypothetical protein
MQREEREDGEPDPLFKISSAIHSFTPVSLANS